MYKTQQSLSLHHRTDHTQEMSFDVVSLFTKVPTNFRQSSVSVTHWGSIATRVVGIIAWWGCLFPEVPPQCRIPSIQRRGVPVGLWYGNGLPCLCLCGQSGYGRVLNTCASAPAFWKCYMDNTFTVIPRGKVQQFHDHLNSIEPTIKFTIGMEQEGSLTFLDTRVTSNSDTSLTTTVFRKKTHSDQYLVFDSHHPLAHKVAVARTLHTRGDQICESAPDTDVEKRGITRALSSSGYPTALVEKNWHLTPHSTPPLELTTPKAVVISPYVQHLSESIQRIISPLKIRTCFRLPGLWDRH